MVTIKFRGNKPFKKEGDAGWDITALFDETIGIQDRVLIRTGLYMEIPPGYFMDVRSRSGLALKHGIQVLNSPGTIDSTYRGEVCVILYNASDRVYKVSRGDKIAQLVLQKETACEFVVGELNDSSRGSNGFGSSGK
jgi:dUTP pyrophosphatase